MFKIIKYLKDELRILKMYEIDGNKVFTHKDSREISEKSIIEK